MSDRATPDRTEFPDASWAFWAGVTGLVAMLSYIALNAVSVPGPIAVALTFGFGFGLTIASVGLHLGVTRVVAPRLGLLAAVANTVAAAQLVAMILVQMAVKATVPRPESAITSIWLGLDVAWDLFVGAGTVLFGVALWQHRQFRPVVASSGTLVGGLLLVLNVATFPTPPAEAGLFDMGPIVGLWYVLLCVRILMLQRGRLTRA